MHTTRLKTGKQMCRSATLSSLCTIQHSPSSLGWLCAQADRDTHRCFNKILLSASVPLNNKTLSCKSLQVPSSHFVMLWKDLSWSRATEAFGADCDDVSVNSHVLSLTELSRGRSVQCVAIQGNLPMRAATAANPAVAPVAAAFRWLTSGTEVPEHRHHSPSTLNICSIHVHVS